METPPQFDPLDYAAVGSALVLLLGGYVVYPHPVVRYGVWLGVFTIWMAWFCFYGVKWFYDIDA